MINFIKKLWKDPVISKVFAGIIILSLTSIISKISTDDWFAFFKSILLDLYFIISISLIAIFFVIKMMISKRRGVNAFYSEVIPTKGWEELYETKRFGVLWVVRKAMWRIVDVYIEQPSDLNIKQIPLCPKCRTELKEKSMILGKYKWFCVNCNFLLKSKDSFYEKAEDVRKIEQGEYRKFLIEKNKNE